jgi:hypothetical protein
VELALPGQAGVGVGDEGDEGFVVGTAERRGQGACWGAEAHSQKRRTGTRVEVEAVEGRGVEQGMEALENLAALAAEPGDLAGSAVAMKAQEELVVVEESQSGRGVEGKGGCRRLVEQPGRFGTGRINPEAFEAQGEGPVGWAGGN